MSACKVGELFVKISERDGTEFVQRQDGCPHAAKFARPRLQESYPVKNDIYSFLTVYIFFSDRFLLSFEL